MREAGAQAGVTVPRGGFDASVSASRAWSTLPGDEVLAALASGDRGLSLVEARARLAAVGRNELPRAKRTGILGLYLRQFKNPLVYLLLAATVVSLFVGELADAIFIFAVLQLNAAIGTAQEWKAEASAEALDALLSNTAVVVRDGLRQQIDTVDLVPGDRVRLESGARVAADLRLLDVRELTVDESLLTGESTPVAKDAGFLCRAKTPVAEQRNMLHAGTTVLSGRAEGVVTATGRQTEIGRIAEALARGEAIAPPLVLRLERFSRVVGLATIILIAALATAQIAQGTPLATVFLVAVALAVAAIPEGLPVAITVALAIATSRMGRRNVIVRSLPAVEGLGACTLIASDKTGTLTCNELTVKRVRLFGGGAPDQAVEVGGEGFEPRGEVILTGRALGPLEAEALRRLAVSGTLCNEASVNFTPSGTERLGDTVDVAFLVLAAKLGLDQGALRREAPQLGLVPYEPKRRYGAAFTQGPQDKDPGAGATVHVKGAAEMVVPMCRGIDREQILAEADGLAAQGYRVLAVACGAATLKDARASDPDALHDLQLLGLVGLIDPVRAEVPGAVARCRAARISVRMITGDHPETALAVARQLDIAQSPAQVVTGQDLAAAGEDPVAVARLVERGRVFARVEPVQKLMIVEALQKLGEVVAVTGDGVNDAPALTAANIGVAMGRDGTDVARGAADLVLADDNFASIVAGVEEGRIAYDNVRKLIYLLIATGFAEIVLFLLSIIFALPLPLFAAQLLWLNLVTNGIQHVALAFEGGEPGILERPPRPPGQSLFDRRMIGQVLVAGVYMGTMAFFFYGWCLAQGMGEDMARNLLLLLMVLFENAHALNARSESRSLFAVPLAANRFLIVAILGAQALHIGVMYLAGPDNFLGVRPVAFFDWILVAAVAASLIVVMEVYKRLAVRPEA